MTATKYKVTLTVTIEREIVDDFDADLSWLEQTDAQMGDGFEEASRERIAAYNRGEWSMVGIRAVARSDETGTIVAASWGLWGIESDSGEEYFEEVFAQETAELLSTLHGEEVK